MMVFDGYGDGEERNWGCEMWNEKIENSEKWMREYYLTDWDSDYVSEVV